MPKIINPNEKLPLMQPDGTGWPHTIFLKNFINHPNIEVGDYTYFNDYRLPKADVQRLLAPYMHPGVPEKLIIGKFCQIAHGVQFITNSANHQMNGFSTYPFATFGEPWVSSYEPDWPMKGDTIVGHDVWLGHESLIMPAVTIGRGAIIASRSVVTKNVPPYTIVGGNPAKVIRARFNAETIAMLLQIKWWDWPIEMINSNIAFIAGADIEKLSSLSEKKECSI